MTADRTGEVSVEYGQVRKTAADRRRLSLRQIEVFRAVMASGTLNGAAKVLATTQPSVSRIVQRCEDILGLTLFKRTKGRLVPTGEAIRLLGLASKVFDELDELGSAVERLVNGDGGLFRIGATGSPGRAVVPNVIARMHEDLPKLQFHIDVLMLEQIIDYLLLQKGECVVSIFPVAHPLIESVPVRPCKLVALVPSADPLAAFDKLTATDLKDKFLILFEPHTPHGSIAEKQFREIGIEPHVGIRVRHIETAIGLVHEGVGIAIVDDVAVIGETGRRFSAIDIDGSPALSVHLSWNREQSQSQMFRHFRRLLHLPAQLPSRDLAGRHASLPSV